MRTTLFRKHRALFLIILYSVFLVWAFLLCPFIFDLFMPTLVEEIPEILSVVALFIEYGMMILFLSIIIYPLNTVFRKTEIGFKEIVLASPATSGDIFLGEFLGKFPIYLAGVLLIGPLVTGLINPIINLNLWQYIIIYTSIFGLVILATLSGSIIAFWLEHKIAKSERARDLGKILLFLLSIAMVAIIYSLQFLFKYLLDNRQLRNWLMFYPSLWFSNIILYFIEPSLITKYFLNIWFSLILVISVPILIFFVSYKKANSFFTVEGGIEKISSIIEKENKFYLLVRKLTGHKWEGLIITQLKEFLRRRESIMKIVYLTGLLGVLGVIFLFTLEGIDPIIKSMVISMLIIMGGMMYALLFGSYIFVGSKDLIWVYKRSPRNIYALIFSFMIAMFIFNILMALGLTIFFTYFLDFNLFEIVFFFSFYLIYCQLIISQAIGLQCLNPSFEEKGRTMTTNNLFLIVLQMVPFQFLIIILIRVFSPPATPELALFYFLFPMLLISSIIALPLLYFGMKKINKLE